MVNFGLVLAVCAAVLPAVSGLRYKPKECLTVHIPQYSSSSTDFPSTSNSEDSSSISDDPVPYRCTSCIPDAEEGFFYKLVWGRCLLTPCAEKYGDFCDLCTPSSCLRCASNPIDIMVNVLAPDNQTCVAECCQIFGTSCVSCIPGECVECDQAQKGTYNFISEGVCVTGMCSEFGAECASCTVDGCDECMIAGPGYYNSLEFDGVSDSSDSEDQSESSIPTNHTRCVTRPCSAFGFCCAECTTEHGCGTILTPYCGLYNYLQYTEESKIGYCFTGSCSVFGNCKSCDIQSGCIECNEVSPEGTYTRFDVVGGFCYTEICSDRFGSQCDTCNLTTCLSCKDALESSYNLDARSNCTSMFCSEEYGAFCSDCDSANCTTCATIGDEPEVILDDSNSGSQQACDVLCAFIPIPPVTTTQTSTFTSTVFTLTATFTNTRTVAG